MEELPKDLLNDYKEHFEEIQRKQEEEDEKKTGVQKVSLPCYPDCLFELTEKQKEFYNYQGDPEDKVGRMKWKLFLIWQIWARFRNNERIIKIVSEMQEGNRDTDFFYICNEMVNSIDAFGRILGITNITEELFDISEKI